MRKTNPPIESKSVSKGMIRSQFPSIPIQELAWKKSPQPEPKNKKKRQFNSLKSQILLRQTQLATKYFKEYATL
jgi:hypothetical protein